MEVSHMRRITRATLVLLVVTTATAATAGARGPEILELSRGWELRPAGEGEWLPATVPGSVHTSLLANGRIPDPFFRKNAEAVRWVDEVDWEYRTTFQVPGELLGRDRVRLLFEGIDTYARVYLNDTLILTADNYFLQWPVDCKSLLKKGENRLRIHIEAATRKGRELLAASDHPLKKLPDEREMTGALNEKKVYAFTRKPGYQFGWDWADRFVSAGLPRPVRLEAWDTARVDSVQVLQDRLAPEVAELTARCEIDSERETTARLQVVDRASGVVLAGRDVDLNKGANTVSVDFAIESPRLWWTSGLGEAHLYTLAFQLLDGGTVVAEDSERVGLRTLRLVRKPDALGSSFFFELNGVPVFMKGANYIPNDSLPDRVTDERYRRTIRAAVDANMNMLRVWGGGYYERDLFYDLCDENGILVWQDFMFGGGIYPAEGHYLESVEEEVRQVVTRLRNRPSIALWCGNNETLEAMDHWGWDEAFTKEEWRGLWDDYFHLFGESIPAVVRAQDPTRSYWPSSPAADWDKVSDWDGFGGDLHYWGVWFANAPFERYNRSYGRFNSEFGFQSFPEKNTLREFSIPEDWSLQSEVMRHRQKSGGGNDTIQRYMEMYYGSFKSFEDFLYLSQVLQAQGVATGIEAHRKHMPICMGSLYWQMNDCWPAISWSSIDYSLRWKALHYFVKEAFKPVVVVLGSESGRIEAFVVSDELEARDATLRLTLSDFSGRRLWTKEVPVTVGPNQSALCFSIFERKLLGAAARDRVFLSAELSDEGGTIDDALLTFVRPKDLKLPEPEIRVEKALVDGRAALTLSSAVLCKNVYVHAAEGDLVLDDNYFDLLPGIPRTVLLKAGAAPDIGQIRVTSLADVMSRQPSAPDR